MRKANLSVQRTALRIWEGGNHTPWTWGGVVGSMENLVKRRGQSAWLFFQMARLHQEGYICEVCLFWDQGLCLRCLGYNLPAMEVNMENSGRQDFCVMISDNVLP